MGVRFRSPQRATALALAVLGAFSMVAASCGGDDDDSATETTVATGGDTSAAEGGDTTAAVTGDTTASTEPAGEPVPGGSLVMGVEAETSSPWRPSEMICPISCHQVIRSVFDPLTLPTEDGGWAPYLAQSVTPNDDYTVWTIKVRDGVTFHDGTPLDGEAVRDNLERQRTSFLNGKSLLNIASVAVNATDPMAVDVTMKSPWVPFPYYMSGALGYIASPTWLAASDADEALRTRPVGTGPFVFQDYKANEYFKATKNPDYWNQPYPYLDAVEFRPIPDALVRRDALKAGDLDLIHTTNGQSIAEFRDTPDEFPMTEITNNTETAHTLLHVTKEGSPLTDQRIRCALANAYDNETVNETISLGVPPIANGPFSPSQVGHLDETGYPMAQDMAKAQQLVAEYKAENPGPLTVALATTQDETNLTIAQFQKQWWEEAGFDEVTIDQIDQGQYITTAALGSFEVFQWRNHGGFDLDTQYVWWHSSSAGPVGELSLNFGRIKDPVIDEMLDKNRAETDPAKKKEYAETVNERFAEQCFNLWDTWTIWGIAHTPGIKGIEGTPIPDSDLPAALGAGIAGTFYVHTLWNES